MYHFFVFLSFSSLQLLSLFYSNFSMEHQVFENSKFFSLKKGENFSTFLEIQPYCYKTDLENPTVFSNASNDSPFLFDFLEFDISQSHSLTPSLSPQSAPMEPPLEEIVRKSTKHKTFCTKCKKYLNRSQDLKRHKLVHTGIRNFHCGPCGGTFSRKDALKRHQKTCASCSSS